jgi:hypothetical protein
MRNLGVGLIVAVTLSACVSGGPGVMDRIMVSWMGASADEVMRQWGYPHEERNVAGKKLLVWHRNVQLAMPVTATTTGTANRVGPSTYYSGTTTVSGGGVSNWSCVRILEVNSENRVVNWQWEGNNCPFMEAGPYANWRRQ